MMWKTQTADFKKQKKLLLYEQKRQWHKWWAWYPVKLKTTAEHSHWVWLEPIYRRATDYWPWRTFRPYRWEYTTDFELLRKIN